MKKFLIFIILNLICVNSAQSTMTVGKYLNDKDSEHSPIVSALKNYVHAAGTAIFWNTVVSNAYNQKTFCPPSNWSPSLNDFINYIDSEIIYAKKNPLQMQRVYNLLNVLGLRSTVSEYRLI